MRAFYISLLCCVVVEAVSTIHFTDSWNGIVAGQPFELRWEGNTGAVNITLNQGSEKNYTAVNTVATNITTTSYTWMPGLATLPNDTFFFTLTDLIGATAVGAKFVIETNNPSTKTPASNSSIPVFNLTNTNSSMNGTIINSSYEAPDSTYILSEGEIIGITVGGFVGFVLVICAIAAIVWYIENALKKKKRRKSGETGEDGQTTAPSYRHQEVVLSGDDGRDTRSLGRENSMEPVNLE